MKTCDVCNSNLGLIRFRYRDGSVCKYCYEKASRNCRETVRQMDLAELKARCGHGDTLQDFDDFDITDRIGNYMLIDKKRKKICIVNNRLQVKEYKKPQVIELDDIRYYRICCNSSRSWEELCHAKKQQRGYAASLGLELFLNSTPHPQQIRILSSTVRLKSFAFRKSVEFMQLIMGYLETNGIECRRI